MNFRGFFSDFECHEYAVFFTMDSNDENWTEIPLGPNPVVINYGSGSHLFSPTKISTCAINVLSNDYLEQLNTPYAQGIKVEVHNTTTNEIVWRGYLKPQIFNMAYENCMESIDLECSDCLASLQYVDYKPVNGKKQIVSFKDIIDQACDMAGVDGYYWPNNKMINRTTVLPNHLTISEQNFFTEDTDEPWTYFTVLEEMCKYLGLTLIQWETYFYFLDVQTFHNNERMSMTFYAKNTHYSGVQETLDASVTISESTYKGSGHQISYEPIYNRATVRSNFYYPDYFLPDIADEDKLTNRYGGTKLMEIPSVINQPSTTNGVAKKTYDNEKFEGDIRYAPVLYNKDGNRRFDAQDTIYEYYNRMFDHEWYESKYYDYDTLQPVDLPDSAKSSTACTKMWIGGTIVETGNVPVTDTASTLNHELVSSISLEKYVCLSRHSGFWGYWQDVENIQNLPPAFILKSGFTNPIITDSGNTYLAIYAEGLFERYPDRNYINPDWVEGVSKGNAVASTHVRPRLVFKLGIGDYYWNGTDWTTTEKKFDIALESNELEYTIIGKKKTYPGDNWNQERKILNNIPWSDWTGLKGYKIPLPDFLDLNQDITFELCIQPEINHIATGSPYYKETSAGDQSAFCWVKDLSVKIANKQMDEWKKEDVVYGGEEDGMIDANSVMELEEITMKFTTFPGRGGVSYSNVGDAINGGFLEGIIENDIVPSYQSLKPEENVLSKYINQYSSQTIKEELTVDMDIAPFQKIYDAYWGNTKHFVWDGAEINLKEARQRITIVQTK